MKHDSPEKEFLIVPSDESCNCNDCEYMKMNTMKKLYYCIKDESPEITMTPDRIRKSQIAHYADA